MKSRLAPLLILPLIPLLISSSCKRENKDTIPQPQPPTTNLHGKPSFTQADLACRVVKHSFTRQNASGTTTVEYTHEYDDKGRKNKMTGSDGHIRTYEYNSLNQLIKLSNDYPANSPSRDDVMLNEFDSRGQWAKGTLTVASSGSNTYVVNRDSQGNRSRIDMVNPTTNQVVATHSYIYSDGNLVKYVSRGNSAISQDSLVTTFQHFTDREDKFEPIAESMGHAYGYETLSKNLISKEILTQYNSGSTNGLSSPPIEYSYEFNDKGFPIKITFLYAGTGAKVIYLYEYQCK